MSSKKQKMSIDDILSQLSSLKDNSQSFITDEKDDDRQIWRDDVTAIEETISIINALQDEGVTDADEVKDMIRDYRAVTKQVAEYQRKFETKARPKIGGENGVYLCPECGHRVQSRHTFCHWCGKKLGW